MNFRFVPLLVALGLVRGICVAPAATVTNLHSFGGPSRTDGAQSFASLGQGTDGFFYGSTWFGGSSGGEGTVFQMTSGGAILVLHTFHGTDGASPSGVLVQGKDGLMYGTTYFGGAANTGTIFRVQVHVFTNLYSFSGSDGAHPYGGLVLGSDGNFYGTTFAGGSNDVGTVFQFTFRGTFTSLYQFSGGVDGQWPYSGLVQGSDSNFYGTTFVGGSNDVGTVFQIDAAGNFRSLHSFNGSGEGANPVGALAQGTMTGSTARPSLGGPVTGERASRSMQRAYSQTFLPSPVVAPTHGVPWPALCWEAMGIFMGQPITVGHPICFIQWMRGPYFR